MMMITMKTILVLMIYHHNPDYPDHHHNPDHPDHHYHYDDDDDDGDGDDNFTFHSSRHMIMMKDDD